MPRERTHWEGCWRERTHHECALVRIKALEIKVEAREKRVEAREAELAAERERLEAAEALLTEARFYMSGHYDFIKPNTGLLELMRRVDAYFGDRALPD